jgi:phosphoribosylglycinamide formyltransferase-1
MKNIAIFASGSGTNAEEIINKFQNSTKAKVVLVVCNNPNAKVIERASNYKIPVFISKEKTTYSSDVFLQMLMVAFRVDLIVLAGYLWLIPEILVKTFPKKIINLHPALLPDYGGKGMYGDKVHEAVLKNKERETGITIHYVNENYDEGNIIYQESFVIEPLETTLGLANKIHKLEHAIYPTVIEQLIS